MNAARIRELYHRALDLPEAERRALLQEIDDPDLRAELGSLLELDDAAQDFLESPRDAAGDEEGLKPGSRVGPYEIVEPLGQGGQGSVYRARHHEQKTWVALKTVRTHSASHVASIRREVRTLARLRHPDIIRIHEEGMEGGIPWYAMELAEGETLAQRLKAEPDDPTAPLSGSPPAKGVSPAAGSDPGEALGIIADLCGALAYLHGEGVVHRDLKPSNVLIRPDGSPVLVDFGLATQFTAGLAREVMNLEGAVAGTLPYMSPEQVRGEFVDARADLYSLGCMLYEILTGTPPFPSDRPQVILDSHLTEVPPPPSARGSSRPDLDALVVRLLEKQPRERLGFASEVAAVLAQHGCPPRRRATEVRSYLYRPALSGRDDVLSRIRSTIDAARRGTGELVLLRGESGVGKTRVAMEAARLAVREQHFVLTAEATAAEDSPLSLLRPTLQQVADHCREMGRRRTKKVLGRRAGVLARFEPSLGLLETGVHPPPSRLPPAESRLRLYRYLLETYRAMAGARAVILVLDDLQWADELSLGFLEYVSRVTLDRVVVIGTYRADTAPPRLEAAKGDAVTTIDLGRLPLAAVSSMIGDMLALPEPPPDLVGFLSRESEGNPFFVAEYLRAALWEELLVRSPDGHWQFMGGERGEATEEFPLPATLRELLEHRLDQLEPSARKLSEVAAVLGRLVEPETLAALAGVPEDEVLDGIEVLLSHQVFEELSGRLHFAHDKLREVAYERISGFRRKRLHREAGEVLSNRPDHTERWAEIGGHWEVADETEKARACFLAGGRTALERSLPGEAAPLLQRYLALSPPVGQESVRARLDLGYQAFRPLGRSADAQAEIEGALDHARRLGFRDEVRRGIRCLAYLNLTTGRLDRAEELYREAIELCRADGDRKTLGQCIYQQAILKQQRGEMDVARGLYEQALDLHRQEGDVREQGVTYANLATLEHQLRRQDRALELYDKALALLEEAGDRRLLGLSRQNLAALHVESGRIEQAEPLLLSALTAARKGGEQSAECLALGTLAYCHHQQGRHSAARTNYTKALAIAREIQDLGSEGFTRLGLSTLDFESGALEEAETGCRAVLSDPRFEPDRHLTAATRCLLAASIRLHSGNLEEAEGQAQAALDLTARLGDSLEEAKCCCELGHLSLARGHSAADHLERAREIATALEVTEQSELGRAYGRLRRAIGASQAGKALWRGTLFEDLPPGIGPS